MHARTLSGISFILLCLAVSLLLVPTRAQAGHSELFDVYTQIKPALEKNDYGIPVYINSRDRDDTMLGVIYGIISHPFDTVRRSLATPANWCDIAPQHLNIKACTYQTIKDYCQLTFYTGRKFYEKAEDVYQLAYRFEISQQTKDYIQVRLTAEDGPAGTRDYRLKIQAIPLDDSTSFVYFSYSYHYNFITSMGMGTYLATLGRGKVGFSVLDRDKHGRPVYVDGVRGIIERNAIRYYLAIQSYLDTLVIPADKRVSARLNHWFDLTERHPLQLHELEKTDYLQYKQQEWQDQQRLQQQLNKQSATDNHCRPGLAQ